jgi:putative hydrolase of the HAD superfamily
LGRITAADFWKGLCENYPALEREYLDSQFQIDPDFLDVAKKLKRKYDLAVLSNDVSRWSAYLRRKYRLESLFKEVVISGDYGYRKPDVRLYRVLLDRLKAPPADCIFVDDNLRNLKVGAELGMTTIHFERREAKDRFVPNYTVKSFVDIPHILESRSPN